jgi:hypothetical protein
MKIKFFIPALLILVALSVLAKSHGKTSPALKNALILVIRHAEKPDSGAGLSLTGEQRAQLYINYFKHFSVDYIFAAADSKESWRPRLTVTPTAKALGLSIDGRFRDKEFSALAEEISSHPHGKNILICWHHGEIPQLLHALGADTNELIPGEKWPSEVFGWVIQLRYDADGNLIEARRLNENLLPDDSDKHATKP